MPSRWIDRPSEGLTLPLEAKIQLTCLGALTPKRRLPRAFRLGFWPLESSAWIRLTVAAWLTEHTSHCGRSLTVPSYIASSRPSSARAWELSLVGGWWSPIQGWFLSVSTLVRQEWQPCT